MQKSASASLTTVCHPERSAKARSRRICFFPVSARTRVPHPLRSKGWEGRNPTQQDLIFREAKLRKLTLSRLNRQAIPSAPNPQMAQNAPGNAPRTLRPRPPSTSSWLPPRRCVWMRRSPAHHADRRKLRHLVRNGHQVGNRTNGSPAKVVSSPAIRTRLPRWTSSSASCTRPSSRTGLHPRR